VAAVVAVAAAVASDVQRGGDRGDRAGGVVRRTRYDVYLIIDAPIMVKTISARLI